MTLTAINSYEEVVPASAPRLVLLSAPTYELGSTSDVNVLNKSIVRKARGFLIGLFVVAGLFVAVGVFHVGAITPSSNTGPTAQLLSANTPNQFPAVVVTQPSTTASNGAISSLGSINP